MTRQEYNENLKRYYKAMEWYHSKPSDEQQEKFLPNFEKLLNNLEQGAAELSPNEHEILHGFNIGGEAD